MMADIAQSIIQRFGYLAQVQSFKIEHFQGPALGLGKLGESQLQSCAIDFGSNLVIQIGSSRQSIAKGINFFTDVETPSPQIQFPVQRAMKGRLYDPRFRGALCGVEQPRSLVQIE